MFDITGSISTATILNYTSGLLLLVTSILDKTGSSSTSTTSISSNIIINKKTMKNGEVEPYKIY